MDEICMILVHGACHGGWCWSRVTPHLEAAGLRVRAPDLPAVDGAIRDPIGRWGAMIAGMAIQETAKGDRVILVGHSRGGVVASAAAEAAPEAVAGLVYLAGSLLPRGQSVSGAWRDFTSEEAQWVLPDAEGTCFGIRPELYHRLFCPDSDAETAAWALARLGPEPTAAFKTPMRVSEARFGRIPRAYIETGEDLIIPPALQRSMRAALPCEPVMALPGDHLPMLARPKALAEALIAIAQA